MFPSIVSPTAAMVTEPPAEPPAADATTGAAAPLAAGPGASTSQAAKLPIAHAVVITRLFRMRINLSLLGGAIEL